MSGPSSPSPRQDFEFQFQIKLELSQYSKGERKENLAFPIKASNLLELLIVLIKQHSKQDVNE